MKRFKKIGILLGVLAAVSIAALCAIKYEEKQEEIQNMDEVILTIDPENVTALAWTNETTSLSFAKTDGNWTYDDDAEFPVDAETVNELLELWNGFEAAFVIDEVEDTAQYGLDEPVATIYVTTSEAIDGLMTAESTEASETTESETAEAEETETTDASESETTETSETTEAEESTEVEESTDAVEIPDEGYTYVIKLGTYSTMDAERYVSIGDGKVYLVDTDPLDLYAAELSDMIDHDETPSYTQIQSLTVEGEESYSISYEEESTATYNSEEDVYFAEIDGETLPLDSSSVSSYAQTLSYLDLTNYVNYKVTDDELADYGLDDPELTVTFDYLYEDENDESVSDRFILHIGRNADEVAEAEEAAAEALEAGDTDYEPETVPTVYARVGDSQIIYEITSDEYDELMAVTYNDLRHRELFWADTDAITQIDVTLEGTSYTFTSQASEEDEETTVWMYGETEIDVTTLESALTTLAAADADSYTDETPGETEEISLTVTLDNENFTTVAITLYRYDGENCLAVVDGETVSLIPRSEVVDLIEAVNAIVLAKAE